jgi:hypothetical protein
VPRAGDDQVAAAGAPGKLAGVRRSHSLVLGAARVGDGGEAQSRGVAADVQEAIGSAKDPAEEAIAEAAPRICPQGRLDEVRGDVLEEGAGDLVGAAERRVGIVAAAAHAPDVEG